MTRKIVVCLLASVFLLLIASADAQQKKPHRVGVIHSGGPYQTVVDGLRHGLKQLGFAEGKQISLEIRDTKSDLKLVEEAAKAFEKDRIDLIYAVTTTVTTVVKDATTRVPIVFAVGTDPVKSNLVQSFGNPGGRLTGVQYSTTDLTAKRLEILKEILPKLSRVIVFYNPSNRNSVEAAALAREAAKHFGIQVLERQAASVEDLRQGLAAIKAGEANAYFYITDAMVNSQARLVVDTAISKNLPAMFSEQGPVVMGGLASYGQNFHEVGRLSAKYVQKVLTGAQPANLRVETVDKYELVINLKTAKQIGLTVPPNVLAKADKVIR